MASIEGPKELEDHVISVSPCQHCRGEEWRWGACTNPTEADAAFIVKAVNNHDALVATLSEIIDYQGGADHAMADEYVVNRARAALAALDPPPPLTENDPDVPVGPTGKP